MITQIKWNDNAERGLQKSGGADLHIIKNQIRKGAAQLWQIQADNSSGYLVTRIDCEGIGKVFVFVLGEGRGLYDVIPHFIQAAQNLGIHNFRTHVQRKGLLKLWKRYGLELDHYVLRANKHG